MRQNESLLTGNCASHACCLLEASCSLHDVSTMHACTMNGFCLDEVGRLKQNDKIGLTYTLWFVGVQDSLPWLQPSVCSWQEAV